MRLTREKIRTCLKTCIVAGPMMVGMWSCGNPVLRQGAAGVASKVDLDKEKEKQRQLEQIKKAQSIADKWKNVKFTGVTPKNVEKTKCGPLAAGGNNDDSFFITGATASHSSLPKDLLAGGESVAVEGLPLTAASAEEILIWVGESVWMISPSSVGFASKGLSSGRVVARYPLSIKLDAAKLKSQEMILGRYESGIYLKQANQLLILRVDRSSADRAYISVQALDIPQELQSEKAIAAGRTDTKGVHWFLAGSKLAFFSVGEDLSKSRFESFTVEQFQKYKDFGSVVGILNAKSFLPEGYLLGCSPTAGLVQMAIKPQK